MIGDALSDALTALGITEERVSRWLGKPCGCSERRERLNRLRWSLKHGVHYVEELLEDSGADADDSPVATELRTSSA